MKKEVNFDVFTILTELSKERPIFHSEADFQHALAWKIHSFYPDAQLRLEITFEKKHLDILVLLNGIKIPIELKYKTKFLKTEWNNEEFNLKTHSAHDHCRYDVLKDVSRIEYFTKELDVPFGYTILLTNDPLYWKEGRENSCDREFSLYEGRTIRDSLSWKNHASTGTIRNREKPISLEQQYLAQWEDYSDEIDNFRMLVFETKNNAIMTEKSSPSIS